jgi:hypothetical protein
MPSTKYIIYFQGDKVKTVYTSNDVDRWEWIAEQMGFEFEVEEISLV